MKILLTLTTAVCIASLSSCALISSILRIPGSIIKTAGRTIGLGLTDEAPDPFDPAKTPNVGNQTKSEKIHKISKFPTPTNPSNKSAE